MLTLHAFLPATACCTAAGGQGGSISLIRLFTCSVLPLTGSAGLWPFLVCLLILLRRDTSAQGCRSEVVATLIRFSKPGASRCLSGTGNRPYQHHAAVAGLAAVERQ